MCFAVLVSNASSASTIIPSILFLHSSECEPNSTPPIKDGKFWRLTKEVDVPKYFDNTAFHKSWVQRRIDTPIAKLIMEAAVDEGFG